MFGGVFGHAVDDIWHWSDWPTALAWIAALATIAAAWFAAWTIRQAHHLADQSIEASLRERRIDHELSVLRAMAEAVASNIPSW
jgi:hypothetical protein